MNEQGITISAYTFFRIRTISFPLLSLLYKASKGMDSPEDFWLHLIKGDNIYRTLFSSQVLESLVPKYLGVRARGANSFLLE